MRIQLTSVLVDDQAKALKFYTEVLGFVKKADIAMGDDRWLTVVSPESPGDVELLLEPNRHPVAGPFQQGLYKDGIPATAFFVSDIEKEYARMMSLGVTFKAGPTPAGPVMVAMFDDTCGNWIQLVQK